MTGIYFYMGIVNESKNEYMVPEIIERNVLDKGCGLI